MIAVRWLGHPGRLKHAFVAREAETADVALCGANRDRWSGAKGQICPVCEESAERLAVRALRRHEVLVT